MTFTPPSHASEGNYKWWVLSCTSLAVFLAGVNSGTLVIALPDLERALHTTLLQLVWVILVYMIVLTVLVLNVGRLADLFGRKRLFTAGFLIFAVTSLCAGFAGSGTELILWRIAQGVGGALMMANAAALVTDAFPRRQLGLALGTNTMIAAAGIVVGPVLGGALVAISWHWVFWFNVPFALLGALWSRLILHDVASRSTERGLDVLGSACYLVGLTGLTLALSKGGLSSWTHPLVLGGFAAAAVLLPLFLVVEARTSSPILDLTLFRDRLFSAACGAAFLNGFVRVALTFLFVFYFQGPQEQSPLMAGLELAPLALAMLVASPLAGLIADRHGSRGLAALGFLLNGIATAGMTTLGAHSPYWQSAIWLTIVGIGAGTFNSPNSSAMMGAVPAERRGTAAGIRTMLQNAGSVISVAFVLAIVTTAVPRDVLFRIFSGVTKGVAPDRLAPFISNMHVALWSLSGICLLGVAVCLLRPSHRRLEHAELEPLASTGTS
jgi:EmrB/QacA subfamily drug resistance transporter